MRDVSADNWLEYVKDFGPILTGLSVLYIAYQQLKVNRKTRISQQYERAINNYHKLVEAQSKAASHDHNNVQLALKELREIRDEAQVCLSKEVVDCVKDVLNKVLEIDRLRAQEKSATSEEERKEVFDKAFGLEVELGHERLWQVYRSSLMID